MAISEADLQTGRDALARTGTNIEQAASYCSQNYLKSRPPKEAIDETMGYATQSLGTMIHQINFLATNFLKMLDETTDRVANVSAKTENLSMVSFMFTIPHFSTKDCQNTPRESRSKGHRFLHRSKSSDQVHTFETEARSPSNLHSPTHRLFNS